MLYEIDKRLDAARIPGMTSFDAERCEFVIGLSEEIEMQLEENDSLAIEVVCHELGHLAVCRVQHCEADFLRLQAVHKPLVSFLVCAGVSGSTLCTANSIHASLLQFLEN